MKIRTRLALGLLSIALVLLAPLRIALRSLDRLHNETRDLQLAFVMVIAMTVTLFIAGLGGILIPVTLKRLKIDPALASTVFATTLTDVVGFFTFLGLAQLLLT